MAVEKYIADAILGNFGHVPTPSQSALFGKLAEFAGGNTDIMLVSGYAGTGKTTAVSAFIKTLKDLSFRYVLLAPTGRAAKVLSFYSGGRAYTIHKQIYRQRSIKGDGSVPSFDIDINKMKDTYFIVDECSLISNSQSPGAIFGSGALLDDLVRYVRSNSGNKLLLVGDPAQLPPVGTSCSYAMDLSYLEGYGNVMHSELTDVVRQAESSGILMNADRLRRMIMGNSEGFPELSLAGFDDIERLGGEYLIEKLNDAVDKYGSDEVIVLCYSNRRANRYNAGIRAKIYYREEELVKGEKLMVVKNCYNFIDDIKELDFIANGDIVELQRIYNHEERYGLRFADAELSLPDYGGAEIKAKIVLDTLASESASLTQEESNALFQGVMEDYSHIRSKSKRYEAVREDPYFSALQVKYASAITCHKSQGGQWDCVFVDNSFWKDEMSLDDKKWLYTAMTRAKKKIYLVNFNDRFFETAK